MVWRFGSASRRMRQQLAAAECVLPAAYYPMRCAPEQADKTLEFQQDQSHDVGLIVLTASKNRRRAMLTAGNVMNRKVVTVRPDTTVASCIDLLMQHRISGLPVTDEQGRLLGVFSEFATVGHHVRPVRR